MLSSWLQREKQWTPYVLFITWVLRCSTAKAPPVTCTKTCQSTY